MTSVAIGKSKNRDARGAGREAARAASDGLKGVLPDFVLAFGTAGYDQRELLAGIREVTGTALLSGCSTSGVITADGSDESTHAVALLALKSDAISFETFQVRGLGADSRSCGLELARQIRESRRGPARLLLLFPDGVTGSVTEFVTALESHLPYPAPIVGGTAGDLLKLKQTWQYHNGQASSDAVSAVMIRGDVVPDVAITHGCEPIGLEQTVTRAEKGWVYEIDHQPAWSVYRQYLEAKDLENFTMAETCYICLAEILNEDDPAYGKYIIRCPLQLDKKAGALFFPGEIRNGTRVRIALRSPEQTVARAKSSAEAMLKRHPGVEPILLLHFDCCCRARLLFGRCTTEASIGPLQEIIGRRVPWFGFNTYGEIAPLARQRTFFHNYSAVLCGLYPAPSR